MFSLDRELLQLRDDAVLDDATAAPLIALERRDVLSLHGELRFLMWAGVMLIVGGVGVIVAKNLDRIGPLVIALAIAAASVVCYAWCLWRSRSSSAAGTPLVFDSILLLGALLASADVGFIEHQWHLLGANWQRHFLLLALLHGVTAYVFASRVLLSLSISALAAFLGIERNFETFFNSTIDMAIRAFTCAAIVFAWRMADAIAPSVIATGRAPAARLWMAATPFSPVFDHFATNLAFWGALILAADTKLFLLGFAIAAVFAYSSMSHGLKLREELFVIYAWVYGLIAVNMLFIHIVKAAALSSLFAIFSITGAIVGLFVIHMRMRGERA